MLSFVSLTMVLVFAQSSLADRKLPLESGKTYKVTVGYNGASIFKNSDGSPWIDVYHQGAGHKYALDFDNPPGDENVTIVAIDAGVVESIYVDSTTGYGFGVKLRHSNNHRTIYAHFVSQSWVQLNQNVTQGQPLGKMGATGWAEGTHLHFEEIDENGNSVKPEPMSGYTNFTPGQSYTSDNYFVVGSYANGTLSQPILTRYTQSANSGHPLGSPRDNKGGGVYVHNWNGVVLQDFYGNSTGFYHGYTSIILNPASTTAHLLKEGFWDCYMNNNGSIEFGSPFTEEITAKYANSPFVQTGDYVQPDNEIVVQKFQWVNSTERRTLVYNKTKGGDARRFPVGEFSIGSDRSENGVQWYVTKDSNPQNDIPWPKLGVLTPTGRWFTKAITG